VAIFLTTTAIDVDEELLNRCLVLTVNETREQTRAIHRLQRERRTLAGLLAGQERETILRRHRNAQRLLWPLPVVNPYAPALTFLDTRTRTRRDHAKYLALIDADRRRGNLYADSRTDPLVGSTSFAYDPFNRRTSVTDPNGVESTTAYDPLDRVTETRQVGASPPTDDLVTTYEYTTFGDLLRTTLPEGNVIQYGYDPAGRLRSVERKPDAATPGERTLYTLDAAGHRTREELQRWDSGASTWVTVSATEYDYSNRCQLDRAVQAPNTPEEAVTEYSYDCNGNLEQVWDPDHPRLDPNTGTELPETSFYQYDANGNRASIGYPGGVSAAYGFDFADRQASLAVTSSGGTEPVVSAAGYLPGGPLSSLALGSGTTETRTFDGRYAPTAIGISGAPTGVGDHTWTYATDATGTVTWEGGFEPSGTDAQQGTPAGALESGIYLRFPGQWNETTWSDATSGARVYYNVNRWYSPAMGRYTRPDPFRLLAGANNYLYGQNTYLYVEANSLVLVDQLGLYGTNDCSYYDQRCKDCGGYYYCKLAPRACRAFGATPDPDPTTDNDFEGGAAGNPGCSLSSSSRAKERRWQKETQIH